MASAISDAQNVWWDIDLPVKSVFGHLNPKDLAAAAQVCRLWNRIAKEVVELQERQVANLTQQFPGVFVIDEKVSFPRQAPVYGLACSFIEQACESLKSGPPSAQWVLFRMPHPPTVPHLLQWYLSLADERSVPVLQIEISPGARHILNGSSQDRSSQLAGPRIVSRPCKMENLVGPIGLDEVVPLVARPTVVEALCVLMMDHLTIPREHHIEDAQEGVRNCEQDLCVAIGESARIFYAQQLQRARDTLQELQRRGDQTRLFQEQWAPYLERFSVPCVEKDDQADCPLVVQGHRGMSNTIGGRGMGIEPSFHVQVLCTDRYSKFTHTMHVRRPNSGK